MAEVMEKGEEQKQPDAGQQHLVDSTGKPVADAAKPAKKRRTFFILGAVLLVAAGVGLFWWLSRSGEVETDDAQVDGHFTTISPRVGGTVISVEVRDNQQVKAGDVLFRIDPRDYEVALKQAQATLADAQANASAARTNVPVTSTSASSTLQTARGGLAEAQAGLAASQTQVGSAEARVRSQEAKVREAQANYDLAVADRERYRVLVEKDEISRQQYDQAVKNAEALRATLESQQAALSEARQGIEVARSNVGQAAARIQQAQAEVSSAGTVPQQIAIERARANSASARVLQAEAAVDRAKLDLSYTVVQAPVTGLVGNRRVEKGQVVAPNQPLLTIVPMDSLFITANFKETQLKEMRVGQHVEIKVDAFGGRRFRGKVDSISPATGARFSLLPPENATGNYVKVVQRVPVKIVLEENADPEHLLRPGMSVVPIVHTEP